MSLQNYIALVLFLNVSAFAVLKADQGSSLIASPTVSSQKKLRSGQGSCINKESQQYLRQAISMAYIKYGKDKDLNAKYIVEAATKFIGQNWAVIILQKNHISPEPYYAYAKYSYGQCLWAEWQANEQQNWLYLMSGQAVTPFRYSNKFSQQTSRGKGVTLEMLSKINEAIIMAKAQIPAFGFDRAMQVTKNINELVAAPSSWNTLIYKCSAEIDTGDYTPSINDFWYASRTAVIDDQCYFTFEVRNL